MTVPESTKDQAIYHTILSDLHRLRATILNLQATDSTETADALREHFGRERSLILSRLSEWRQRRPEIYENASEDFAKQSR